VPRVVQVQGGGRRPAGAVVRGSRVPSWLILILAGVALGALGAVAEQARILLWIGVFLAVLGAVGGLSARNRSDT